MPQNTKSPVILISAELAELAELLRGRAGPLPAALARGDTTQVNIYIFEWQDRTYSVFLSSAFGASTQFAGGCCLHSFPVLILPAMSFL